MNQRAYLKDKKRIVIKIGSSSLTHEETGNLNLAKIEKLIRVISDLKGQGKEVILVSSGAMAAGREVMGHIKKPVTIPQKQALAAIGQARLMTIYQKFFSEYGQVAAQILMTKNTILDNLNRYNARNTFEELLKLGVVPIVNENDTVATYEIEDSFGDNDRLSAVVAALIHGDLLILLSDIDGFYTNDPKLDENAAFIDLVPVLTEELLAMGKDTSGSFGTGGMAAKLAAACISTDAGTDMVIANGEHVEIVQEIINGENQGTLFLAHKNANFDLMDCLSK